MWVIYDHIYMIRVRILLILLINQKARVVRDDLNWKRQTIVSNSRRAIFNVKLNWSKIIGAKFIYSDVLPLY